MASRAQPAPTVSILSIRVLDAAAALLGKSRAQIAREAGVTASHLHQVATGQRRGSQRLMQGLARALGGENSPTWRFVIGEVASLPASARKDAA